MYLYYCILDQPVVFGFAMRYFDARCIIGLKELIARIEIAFHNSGVFPCLFYKKENKVFSFVL